MQQRDLEQLFAKLAAGTKTDPEAFKQAVKGSNAEALTGALPEDARRQVEAVLSDQNKLNELLNSSLARRLMKELQG